MSRVNVIELKQTCFDILTKFGITQADADIIADSIEYAHTRGKHTHGIGRMPIYVRKMKAGLLNPNTPMTVINEFGAVSVLDAENGFGQVAAIRGADVAIEKAKQFGVGLVGIRNSNNFGTAGFIGEYVVRSGMACIVFSNSAPAIAPTGGSKPFLGTNPICMALPTFGNNAPIIFDMACSNAARGKVRLAAKNGEPIPLGWAVDENGNETTDPVKALAGSMIAMGGHKGFGLAMCVDLFAGMMTGSAFAGDVKNLNHPTEISRYGHMIIAVNPQCFMNADEYDQKISYFIDKERACGAEGRIFYPGEKSFQQANECRDFVEIKENLICELISLAEENGVIASIQIK